MKFVALFALLLALATIPFGLPGVWMMMAVLAAAVFAGWLSWQLWAILLVLAAVAELAEFFVLKKMGERYGGSRAAFWGAVLGGFTGMFVGVPVPVVGPVLAGLIGTFAGAAAVTLYQTRSVGGARRVGWGMTLARVFAVVLKVGAGVAVIIVGGSALFMR